MAEGVVGHGWRSAASYGAAAAPSNASSREDASAAIDLRAGALGGVQLFIVNSCWIGH
jgi:hypothetical protein